MGNMRCTTTTDDTIVITLFVRLETGVARTTERSDLEFSVRIRIFE